MGAALEDGQDNKNSDPSSAQPLGGQTATALADEVAQAKARGWLQSDLQRYFRSKGIDVATYKAALNGASLAADVYSTLAAHSVHGLPDRPATASAADIRRHIEWLIEPALGAYDDALVEIAFDGPGRGPTAARLFGLDEIDAAVAFVLQQNAQGSNIYIGAALRMPDANRVGRCSAEDFYVATAVPIDIDKDYDATRARMAAVCDDGLVVTTGIVPERRSQHWTRLVAPCDNDIEFGAAFASLVHHTGADMAVKDAARIMRMGGTVAYPNERKVAAGYCTESTTVNVNPQARPSSIEALVALAPGSGPAGARFDTANRPPGEAGAIEYGGAFGTKVVNGRETFFRGLLLRHLGAYQAESGADPSVDDLFDSAFATFQTEADNTDNRWTSADGQKELRKRAANTIRRLRLGRLAREGLYSIDTEVGRDEALAKKASREERYSNPQSGDEAKPGEEENDEPFCAVTLTGEPPERRWVVPEWVPEGMVTSLYGDGGLGKTLLMQQLACAAATGAAWLGLPVVKCTVLGVLCEDEKDELHRRQNDIKAAMGHAIGNPFDSLWLWPRLGRDNTLVRWKDGAPGLTPFAARLVETIERLQPDLLILDTLADFYGGNEIDRVQVNHFVKAVLQGMIEARKRQGQTMSVILLGHPSVAGKATGSGYSGSTAWNAAVRSRMYLTRPEEGASDERVLTRGKANYAKSGDETAVRLFYADGVLHAQNDASDGDSVLWACKRDIIQIVDRAWRGGEPFTAAKTHRKFIFAALPLAMQKAGFGGQIVRQAIRECVEDGDIKLSNSNGKRGYRGTGHAE